MKKISLCLICISVFMASTFISAASSSYEPDSNAPRSTVPDTYKWKTDAVFKNDAAWGAALQDVERGLQALQAYKGKLDGPGLLKKCLEEFFKIRLEMSYVSLYAELKVAEDKDVEKYQKIFQRTSDLSKEFNAKTSFIQEKILRLDDASADRLLADKGLGEFKSFLEELRRRKTRILDEDSERILAQAGDTLFASSIPTSDIELIFKAIMRDIGFPKIKDEEGKEVQLNLSNYSKYRSSTNREVRKAAVESFLSSLREYENIFTASLAGEIKRDVFFADARRYERSIDAFLDIDNIDPRVVDNLINTIHGNLTPLRRYVALRKKILNIPSVHLYDLYTPLVKSIDRNIPYNEGSQMVAEALKPLGDDYADVILKAEKPGSGWIDIYPNKGKDSGAFSTSAWGIHPFIKLNYQNEIDDVSTIAHELGHTMHSYLNMKAQPYVTSGYSTFTAEIASTFNETLLTKYLQKKYQDDDTMRLYILGSLLEQIRTTIYRQTLFAEFEKKIHEYAERGAPLTAELFNKTYIDLVKLYYGPGLTIGKDDEVEWAFIPHFYYKYYVFTYATGLSSGIALATKVLSEGDAARDRYIAMIEEPSTAPPIEILKKAGADLTKPDVIKAATNLMDETITEIEKIVAKRK